MRSRRPYRRPVQRIAAPETEYAALPLPAYAIPPPGRLPTAKGSWCRAAHDAGVGTRSLPARPPPEGFDAMALLPWALIPSTHMLLAAHLSR